MLLISVNRIISSYSLYFMNSDICLSCSNLQPHNNVLTVAKKNLRNILGVLLKGACKIMIDLYVNLETRNCSENVLLKNISSICPTRTYWRNVSSCVIANIQPLNILLHSQNSYENYIDYDQWFILEIVIPNGICER